MREKTTTGCWRYKHAVIFISSALLAQSAYPQTASIRKDNFETGTIQSSIWNVSDTPGCITSVQTGGAADGTHHFRSTLTAALSGDGGNYRCELRARDIDDPTKGYVKEGDTVYYGMSYRIPAATAFDPLAGDNLTQWFQNPNIGGTGCHQTILLENNVMKWHNHNCGSVGGPDVSLISSVPKDTWIRICEKAKWTTHNDGEMKVWVNPASESSSPAKSYSGRTLIDGWTAIVMFKVGLYKPMWRERFTQPSNVAAMSPRIFDLDDIRVGRTFADACGKSSDDPIPKPPTSVAVD